MVSTLARILDVSFKRIQFTPDLMPSDITGTNVLDEDEHGKRSFRFVEGPIFTNILLADEINRTPPKTQAALLQAMQERESTVGQFLINGGKALAAMDGRFSVAIDDIKKIAIPVLRHRLSTNFQAQAEGMTTEDIVIKLIKEIPEPEIPKFSQPNMNAPPPPSV